MPIAINLEEPLADKLTAIPKFPALTGTAKSNFDFNVTVKNDSPNDMTVALKTNAPEGFTTTYKEGYSTQEITSLVIKANESKDLTVSIEPSPSAAAGKVLAVFNAVGDKASAEAKLTLDIGGQPALSISGPDERLSGDAYAGQRRTIPLIVRNYGSAPAVDVKLASTPPTDWKIAFDPKELPSIAAGEEQTVNVLLTPAAKAIAGDYMVSLSAGGEGVSGTADYRVTVLTSTLWGVTGVGVIGVALLVLVGAVGKFGGR